MKLFLYFLIPSLLLWVTKFEQGPDPVPEIITGLQSWHDNHPQEKVYVHTDREKYLAGDQLWFKLWCAIDNKPSFLSRIIYVELTDATGTVVAKKMCHLDSSSSANGVIDIGKDVKSGNYSLNSYSLWMLNYPAFIFRKNLFIYNSDYTQTITKQKKNEPRMNFYPEGGDMIEEVSNRIAFKINSEAGFPLSAKGELFTNAGVKVLDFQSTHDGMGMFELSPAVNTSYVARLTFDNGTTGEFKLPSGKKEGVVLQVQNSSASRMFLLINRAAVNKEKYNKLFVIAQINGIPVYKANFNIDEGESGASILKKNLPPGILQITLFDSTGNPLAERLSFIDNHKIIEPILNIEKRNTNKRGHNFFTFKLDSVSIPAISVSVVNSSIDPVLHTKENIVSSLLLSSDVKGYIHNPGYYFRNKDQSTLQNLDLLLMTQGWRRFTWKEIKGQENISLKYPVESFMSIKGKVIKSDRPDPITSGYVTIMIKGQDSLSILSNAYLTDKGEFIIDSLQFKDQAEISFQGTNNKRDQLAVDVKIYPAYIDTLKKSVYKPVVADTATTSDDRKSLADYIQEGLKILDTSNKRIKILEGISIKGKRASTIDSLQKEYVSNIYETSDQTLVIPTDREYVNIWQYLNANVPGINVNPFEPGGVTNVRFGRAEGLSSSDSDSYYVTFLLNEIPVSADVIDGLSTTDVALIKVYKGANGFAFGANAGAIAVYTKKGVDASGSVFDKKFRKAQKLGFAVSREFYDPDYSSYPELNKNIVDDRQLIYWNSKIKPARDGTYRVSFHNSDVSSSFKLIIQGIDANGKLIYKEQQL